MSSGKKIMIGFGARKLRDKDMMSKSDPFLMISRPSISGGFTMLRTSETKKNTLNPDWGDFFFEESELIGQDRELNLKFEVFDDDGKKGYDKKDKLLGSCWLNLKQLEAAALVKSPQPLSDGKSSKSAGHLVVRSYKEMSGGEVGPGAVQGRPNAYPGAQGRPNAYPGAPSPYPPQPGMGGSVGGYPQHPQSSGYQHQPPGMGGYPSGQPGGVYSGGQSGGGYPQGPAYPGGQPGGAYPSGQPGYPQGPGYPTQNMNDPTMYPASNLPEGQGGWMKPPQ